MTAPNHYGKAPWIAAIITSIVVTFVGTLLFAQSVWSHGRTPTANGDPTTNPTTNPATQPTTQTAGVATPITQDATAASPRETATGTPIQTTLRTLQTDAEQTTFDHAPWDEILGNVVANERVDYQAVRDTHKPALDAYLDDLATLRPETLSGLNDDAQLALLINLYNAEMIATVAERYEPGYSVSRDGFAVFDEPLVTLAGQTFSLNDLEHRIIRVAFDEPGIHAALVCAALSCPPILPDAYTGATLDATLRANVEAWLASDRNDIDHAAKTLRLSSIFDWYKEDFEDGNQAAYVNDFTDKDVSGYAVEFLEYDWTLNDKQ